MFVSFVFIFIVFIYIFYTVIVNNVHHLIIIWKFYSNLFHSLYQFVWITSRKKGDVMFFPDHFGKKIEGFMMMMMMIIIMAASSMMMMIFKSKFIYFIFFSLSSLIFVFKWQKNVYFFFSTILDDDDDGNFLWLIWIEFPSEDDDKDCMIKRKFVLFLGLFHVWMCVCVAYFLRLNVSISFIKFFPIFFSFLFYSNCSSEKNSI